MSHYVPRWLLCLLYWFYLRRFRLYEQKLDFYQAFRMRQNAIWLSW